MSLKLTAASRVAKRNSPRKNPLAQLHRRKSASTSSPRRTSSNSGPPIVTTRDSVTSWPGDDEDVPTDVLPAVAFLLARIFSPLPATLVGLGLSRDALADVLSFRRALPPVVPLSHLHALLPSRTATERSVAALVADGTLRRVKISSPSQLDGVMLADDFLKTVAQSTLSNDHKEAFLALLFADPALGRITGDMLPRDAIMALLAAGFLTIDSADDSNDGNSNGLDIAALTATTAPRDHTHLSTLSSMNSRSPHSINTSGKVVSYTVTPPNLGLLTNLLATSKSHLLSLLRRDPHRQATMAHLRESWDGGVSKNKHRRNHNNNADGGRKFEGRTRKWRDFRGVNVDWVVAGLVGAGTLETFRAVGLGRGVRIA